MKDIIIKKCSVCNTIKPIYDYYFRKTLNIYNSKCKNCVKEERKIYVNNNKELVYANNKLYRDNNLEHVKTTCKKYRNENRHKILEKSKLYYKENVESKKQYNKSYYKLNSKILIKNQYAYKKNRLKSDNTFRLIETHRSRIRMATLPQKCKKFDKSIELICCTIEQYWSHIEKQFRDGMTRENYGKVWHIDHIIPLSFFNLSDSTEQKLAFHWANTQPLFAKENLEKGDKIPQKTNFKYFE